MCLQTTLKLFTLIVLGSTGILAVFTKERKQDNGSHQQKQLRCSFQVAFDIFLWCDILKYHTTKMCQTQPGTSNGVVSFKEPRFRALTGQAPFRGAYYILQKLLRFFLTKKKS